MYSFYPGATYSSRRQHRPAFNSYTPFQAPVIYTTNYQDQSFNDSSDEEELLLRAALERKQQQRLARRQYRQQQQYEQQLLIEQQRQIEQQRYEALLEKERARQIAIARAQAQYEAEQEAILQFRRSQQAKEQLQRRHNSALEALVFQGIHQAPKGQDFPHRARTLAESHSKAKAIAEAKKQAAAAALTNATNGDSDEDSEEQLNPLGALFEALFFPYQKRPQAQEENYPCKRRQQQQVQENVKADKEQAEQELKVKQAEQELKAKQEQQKKAQQNQKEEKATDSYNEVIASLPAVLSLVEAIFGGDKDASSQGCSRGIKIGEPSDCRSKSNGSSKVNTAATTARSAGEGPSSSESSPELVAADILRQRQRRNEEKAQNLQQKHSELNLIESALDSFALDLAEALEGAITEENKKVVISAEDNISKAMFKIDSVQSDGDLSVRQRRKELIKKSQDMLELVDKFKTLETNTGKKVDRNTNIEVSSETKGDATAEAEPADIVDSLPVTTDSVTQDQDEDEEEVVKPYTVAVTTVSSPSVTVQDDSEQSLSEPISDENEGESLENKAATFTTAAVAAEEKEAKVNPEGSESPKVADSTHDDYEIVPEF
ncbi:hypothetical protein BGZ49_003155 [Haplosporangium sp. Z 27]|nr:hypothetical protein BGZ49_003155 [Haplosporangium sp. Z 27]